jgi:hypothetical protein
MIDELRDLLKIIGDVPVYALWLALGFLVYKLATIGSIYAVIRLLIDKGHDAYTAPKVVKWDLDGIVINDAVKHSLSGVLARLTAEKTYLRMEDIALLSDAIDTIVAERTRRERELAETFKVATGAAGGGGKGCPTPSNPGTAGGGSGRGSL